ncbi:hypothetical protein PMIN02_011864 [Paraphaeosphaeria minitans]|uniref:DUF7607 domain-containing protein n=1 Tax=Paraphaeosphaeria minitans TaxID=565426 RepID=A0A9P6KNJ0_9PLEO|nr:hypothetical protein PMIN01_08001 [Paraphaeosphaeria minitans]
MDQAAAKNTHTVSLGVDARNSGKRQKRAALVAITPAEHAGKQQTLPATSPPTFNRNPYEHLLHWDQDEGDRIVEWDEDSWGQNDDIGEEEDDDGDNHVRDAMEDEGISEGLEYNDLDAPESAIRQMTQQAHPKVGNVPEETIIKIINESMEVFANEWSPVKDLELLPDHDEQSLDPIRLWEDAEALGHREELVEKYKYEIQLYESKLDTLAAEICKIPQKSEKQVHQHCRNLEMHVHNREGAKWYLSIYELPPAASEPGRAEEQHTNMSARPAGRHVEVIDLRSSSESSDNGDGREMIVDAEEQITGQDNTIDDAGTMRTPHQEPDTEMIVDRIPTMAPDITAPRTLTLTRLRNLTPEPEVISSVESDVGILSSATRHPSLGPSESQQPLRNRPEIASILTVSGWDMEDLVVTKDRKRVTMKMMLHMSTQEREMIHKRIKALKKSNLLKEISTCIDMLYRKEQKMLGVLPSDLPKIRTITNFFLCWWFADNYMYKLPTEEQLHELATELHQTDDLELFYDWVHYILHKTFSEEAFRNAHAPSKEEIIVVSDDEEQPVKSRPLQNKSQPKQVQSRCKPQDRIVMLE